MAISEGMLHLEYISSIEERAKMKGNDSKLFSPHPTHSLPCLQFYYLYIFQVELAVLKKLGNSDG